MQRFAVLFLPFPDTLQEFFPSQVVTGQPFVFFNFHFHFNLYQAKCILLFVRCFKEGKSTFPNPPKPIYFDFFFSGIIVVYWFVNMWTRVRCLTSNLILVVLVQVSQKSKLACCNKPHYPLCWQRCIPREDSPLEGRQGGEEVLSIVIMENNPLMGLFGVSPPRAEPQLFTPQPITPTENGFYVVRNMSWLWTLVLVLMRWVGWVLMQSTIMDQTNYFNSSNRLYSKRH